MLPMPVGPATRLPPMFCTVDRPSAWPTVLFMICMASVLTTLPLSKVEAAPSRLPMPPTPAMPPAPAAPVPADAAPENPMAPAKAPAMGLTMAWMTGRSTMLRNRPLMYSQADLPPCIRASERDWPIWSVVRRHSSSILRVCSMLSRTVSRLTMAARTLLAYSSYSWVPALMPRASAASRAMVTSRSTLLICSIAVSRSMASMRPCDVFRRWVSMISCASWSLRALRRAMISRSAASTVAVARAWRRLMRSRMAAAWAWRESYSLASRLRSIARMAWVSSSTACSSSRALMMSWKACLPSTIWATCSAMVWFSLTIFSALRLKVSRYFSRTLTASRVALASSLRPSVPPLPAYEARMAAMRRSTSAWAILPSRPRRWASVISFCIFCWSLRYWLPFLSHSARACTTAARSASSVMPRACRRNCSCRKASCRRRASMAGW